MQRHLARLVLLLALMVAAGLATAQIDDRAREQQRLVFDDDGRLVGFVAEVAEAGVMVGVLDEPLQGNPFVGRDATIHLVLEDGTTQPFMRMRFEDARVDEPIDPAAFE